LADAHVDLDQLLAEDVQPGRGGRQAFGELGPQIGGGAVLLQRLEVRPCLLGGPAQIVVLDVERLLLAGRLGQDLADLPGRLQLRGRRRIGPLVLEVGLDRVVGQWVEPADDAGDLLPLVERQLGGGPGGHLGRHQRASAPGVVVGPLGKVVHPRAGPPRVLDEQLGGSAGAVLQLVLVSETASRAMVRLPASMWKRRAPSSWDSCVTSTATLRSRPNGTVAVAPSGKGSVIPCPANAPSEKIASGPRSSSPPVWLANRATRNGCDADSGTPPSGAKSATISPGIRRSISITMVALLSGTVTAAGRS